VDNSLFLTLEETITTRNPFLANRLKPGLPEAKIREMLNEGSVIGEIQPIIQIYAWHNGTVVDMETPMERTSFFPSNVYQFIDLETAIEHFAAINLATHQLRDILESSRTDSTLVGMNGLCFPIFSNGATSSIAIDLSRTTRNRILSIEFESPEPLRNVYDTFEDFIRDAIRANRDGVSLTCFK
jgi:hypothetical protein